MEFLRKFGSVVTGILNGFDRLAFRGTLRSLSHEGGMRVEHWAGENSIEIYDKSGGGVHVSIPPDAVSKSSNFLGVLQNDR